MKSRMRDEDNNSALRIQTTTPMPQTAAMADAQLRFAAANLADIKNRMCAPADATAAAATSSADPMKS